MRSEINLVKCVKWCKNCEWISSIQRRRKDYSEFGKFMWQDKKKMWKVFFLLAGKINQSEKKSKLDEIVEFQKCEIPKKIQKMRI